MDGKIRPVARPNHLFVSSQEEVIPIVCDHTLTNHPVSMVAHVLAKKRAIGLVREILCCRREVNKLIIEYKTFK